MKLHASTTSPFARKVNVVALETGLAERIQKIPAAAHPVNRSAALVAVNPLGQVPVLETDDGVVLYDSRVICEYLDTLAGAAIFPAGAARWRALRDQSLADGLLDAAILVRYETAVRPPEFLWESWRGGQWDKVVCSLDSFEADAGGLGQRVDIGTITLGCALGYLDFRYAASAWRDGRPRLAAWFARFSERPSMVATKPSDPKPA